MYAVTYVRARVRCTGFDEVTHTLFVLYVLSFSGEIRGESLSFQGKLEYNKCVFSFFENKIPLHKFLVYGQG